MARTRYATDRGLIVRMGGTMFLLGLVFTGFVIALYFVLFDYSQRGNTGGSGGSSDGIIVLVLLIGVTTIFLLTMGTVRRFSSPDRAPIEVDSR